MTAVSLPPFDDVLCQCDECRKAQRRREHIVAGASEVHFPTRCAWCGEPTALVTLVPVAVSRTRHDTEWRVRVLEGPTHAVEREIGPEFSATYCLACDVGLDAWVWGGEGGSVTEMRSSAHCSTCGAATELVAVKPVVAARSHDNGEWYLLEIEPQELECLRFGVDPWDDAWPS